VKQLNALYYKWKDKDFAKELQKESSTKKLALENPDLKVGDPSVMAIDETDTTGPNDYQYDDYNY
jgi:hypothetical protein